MLDVDNGPEPVSGDSNRDLYTVGGIRRIRDRLNRGGAFLLWSGFGSETFRINAQQAGFDVACLPGHVGLREDEHFIQPLGPVLAVRPYCHNDHDWQVYFDTNRAIRGVGGDAGFPAPQQHVFVRSGT